MSIENKISKRTVWHLWSWTLMCYYYNKPDCCIYHTVLQRASEKNIGNTFDLESTYTSLQQEEDNSWYSGTSRTGQDPLPVTTRKCCCKIPSLGSVMKETILQKLEKPPSINCCLVGWVLIRRFGRVSALCLKVSRNGGYAAVFSFKVTKSCCDWMCSAVVHTVRDAAGSLRSGTTVFFFFT